MKHRLVATAGHVDHGKTALLKQLTGTETDRLDEEQDRGLTIDLGFADRRRDDCHIGFIDVPGHHNFIKNMVSGMGSVQGVLFVVSAVDGWQAQSREHFEIINLLEPDRVVFAITKVDLADEELALLVEGEIEQAVEGTAFEDAPVLPVSSETGEGIPALEDELFEQMNEVQDPPDEGKPYCPVDREFTVQGQGTVVTGSLSGGSLSTEDPVILQPAGESGRVRGIQQYHEDVDRAQFPARVAVNVPDWDADDVGRGDVLTVSGSGRTAGVVDGHFRASRHLKSTLDHDTQVLAYLGTGREEVRILTPDQKSIGPAETIPVRLKHLEGEGFYRPGDRVIVRDFSDRRLLGCLTVLNAGPSDSLGDQSYRSWLDRRFPMTPNNYLATELDRSHVATLSELSEGTGFAANRLEEQARELDSIRFVDEQTVANEQWWEDQLSALTENVDTYHRDHPQRPGLPLEDIPAELDPVREPVLAALADRGYVAEDAYLRRSDFEAHLTDEGKQKREALLETLRDQGLETDDRDDLEEQYGAEVVSFCHWKGDVVVLSDQRLVAASVYDDLVDRIIEYMSSEQPCRLSELRDCLDSSRQYVIPLMEHLDQEGMTVRDDDVRYLGDGVAQSG